MLISSFGLYLLLLHLRLHFIPHFGSCGGWGQWLLVIRTRFAYWRVHTNPLPRLLNWKRWLFLFWALSFIDTVCWLILLLSIATADAAPWTGLWWWFVGSQRNSLDDVWMSAQEHSTLYCDEWMVGSIRGGLAGQGRAGPVDRLWYMWMMLKYVMRSLTSLSLLGHSLNFFFHLTLLFLCTCYTQ